MANKQKQKRLRWWNIALPIITPIVALGIAIPVTWKLTRDQGGGDTPTPTPTVVQHTITYDDCHKDGSTITTTKVNHDELTIMVTPEHRDEQGFLGWKEVKQDESPESIKAPYFDFKNRTITQDLKLYGWWKYDVDTVDKDGKQYFKYEYIDGVGPYIKWNFEDNPIIPEYRDFNLVLPKTTPDGKPIIGVAPYAFYDSSKGVGLDIRTISLPDSIQIFSNNAFWHCSNLRIINFPKKLFSIQPYCFGWCAKISDINLNEGLERIEAHAFDCQDQDANQFLKNITFPKTLKYIGEKAFYYSAIEKVDMSNCDNVQIYNNAFDSCWYLKSVTLPDELEQIPDSCFNKCNSLRYFNIPKGVKSIGTEAFSECCKIRQITIADDSELLWIGQSAFRDCYSLEKINLPHKLKFIDAGAFQNCPTLNNVSFANKRQWIYAFGEGEEEKTLDTPKTSTYENAITLRNNIDWRWMVAPEKLYDTSKNYNVSYITNDQNQCYIVGFAQFPETAAPLNIPAKITSTTGTYDVIGIASDSFLTRGSTNITEVVFELDGGKNYLQYIGTRAFFGQKKLVNINLNVCTELKEISDQAFYSCFMSQDIEIPDCPIDLSSTHIKYIGDEAFCAYDEYQSGYHSPITEIKLPTDLETLGSHCFARLTRLTSFVIPEGSQLSKINYHLTEIEGSYVWYTQSILEGTKVDTIDLSNVTQLKFIARGTFQNLENTTKIILPKEGLLEIGSRAFEAENWVTSTLTTINIPSTCLLIGAHAFDGTQLNSATFADNTSQWLIYNGTTWDTYDTTEKTAAQNADALLTTYPNYSWIKI